VRFINLLKKRVTEHGQQTFYHIKDTDGKVVDLFEHAHRFKLDYVIAEHNRRMENIKAFEAYDSILERDNAQLSRGVVESFSSESFQEKIEIRFCHREDFEMLPDSCLFMMALESKRAMLLCFMMWRAPRRNYRLWTSTNTLEKMSPISLARPNAC
jgi:hypothetical protein